MRTYKSRTHKSYLAALRSRLSLEGEDGLISKSLPINQSFVHEGQTFNRCCSIDFLGIAATNLFDTAANFGPGGVQQQIEAIFSNPSELNNRGIFIKFRILLVYPFSVYALSRIQAESTRHRSSMEEPIYPRDFNTIEGVDDQAYLRSTLIAAQTSMLDQLQEWAQKHNWSNAGPNKVWVRFSPVSPNMCALFINDSVFCDPYVLAKRQRSSRMCEYLGPLVEVRQQSDNDTFHALQDHFRYLWDLDVSLFCDDATEWGKREGGKLSNVLPPGQVTFDRKAEFILTKNPSLTVEQADAWKRKCQRVLQMFCADPADQSGQDTVFISCSWEKDVDNQSYPHRYATELEQMFREDFGMPGVGVAPIRFEILQGEAGQSLRTQLYDALEASSYAVVLLTQDIQSRQNHYYSRPNIYHELGYMMKKLGHERTAIVVESNTTVPSNVNDVFRIGFEPDHLVLAYPRIADWLAKRCGLRVAARKAIHEKFCARMDMKVAEKKISRDQGDKAKARAKSVLIAGSSATSHSAERGSMPQDRDA